MAVGILLQDEEQLEVVKGQGEIQPPHAAERGVGPTRRLGLAHRADAPRAIPGGDRRGARDLQPLVVDLYPPLPRADLGKAAGLQRHPPVGEHRVRLLHGGGEQPAPRQVGGDPLGALQCQAQLL